MGYSLFVNRLEHSCRWANPARLCAPMAERWKNNLRNVLKERGLDYKNTSIQAGLNPSMLSEILGKKDKDPSVSTLMKLVNHLKLSFDELLTGASPVKNALKTAPVIGETAAGQWLEPDSWDEAKYPPVPFVPTRFADLEQRAYRVIGNSMNDRDIHDGAFVITVEYSKVRTQPQDGDIVVVERQRDGGLVERTIKEIVIKPDRIELTPRSTDERFRDPFIIRRDLSTNPDDPIRIEIVALVIGSYMPVGGR